MGTIIKYPGNLLREAEDEDLQDRGLRDHEKSDPGTKVPGRNPDWRTGGQGSRRDLCHPSPGSGPPYHYHEKRESLILAVSGEAAEILEGKEIPIKAGDVIYIPQEKNIPPSTGRTGSFVTWSTSPALPWGRISWK